VSIYGPGKSLKAKTVKRKKEMVGQINLCASPIRKIFVTFSIITEFQVLMSINA
jgi:hypothetical protein